MNANLYDIFAARFPQDRTACCIETGCGRRYSWDEMDRASARIASLLASLDLPHGARVAVQVDKSPEAVMLYLATLRAGLVYLPLNTAYRAAEIEYFLNDAQPSVVVCSPANADWVQPLADSAGTRHVYTLDELRGGVNRGTLLDQAASHADRFDTVQRQADDLAAILYTSGTTGRSKGAMLSHGNLSSNALVLRDYWQWQPDDVLLHALPLFHIHGLFVACNGALINGSKMIFLSRFDSAEVVRQLPQATVFMGVPTYYTRLLDEPAFRPRRLRPHAAVRLRLRAAAAGDLHRLQGAQRPYDTGALWHERDRDADVQPVRRHAAARLGRQAAARRVDAHRGCGRPCMRGRRNRRHRSARPQCVQGLLAHA